MWLGRDSDSSERLTATFPEAWAEMLETLTTERLAQKQAGASMAEMRKAAFAKLVTAFGPPDLTGPV